MEKNMGESRGFTTKWIRSSTKNPCPVCDRTKDGDCRISEDEGLVLCHSEVNGRVQGELLGEYIWVGSTDNHLWGKWIRPNGQWTKNPAYRPVDQEFRFPYTDKTGQIICTKVRVYQNSPNGSTKKKDWWEPSGVKSNRLLPYRYLDAIAILEQDLHLPLFIDESELTVDELWKLGIPAIAFGRPFKERQTQKLLSGFEHRLVVSVDRDRPGVEKAQKYLQLFPMARWLRPYPESAFWLPEWLPPSGGLDLRDWLLDLNLTPEKIFSAIETPENTHKFSWEIYQPQDSDDQRTSKPRRAKNQWKKLTAQNGEIGILKIIRGKDGELEESFDPRCNFDFKIVSELIGETCSGIEIDVQRSFDNTSKIVFMNARNYSNVEKFTDSLTESYGAGVICLLSKNELGNLIHTRIEAFRSEGGQCKRLIERRGQQTDGIWVFKNCQFKADGTSTDSDESGWVYTEVFPGSDDYMPSPQIAEYDPTVLERYLKTKQQAFGQNFLPSVLVDGAIAANLHSTEIIRQEGFFPLVNVAGDPGSLKTVATEASLSLVGLNQFGGGSVSKITESALYERLKRMGGLVTVYDDPPRDRNIDEMCKRIYNRLPRIVRGNTQYPNGGLLLTTNHLVGEDNAAVLSRFVPLYFPVVSDINKHALLELREIQKLTSGCFRDLLKLGYPRQTVKALERELSGHLGTAHSRVAINLAIVTYYAIQIMELAGLTHVDVKGWVMKTLCPQLSDTQSGLDSISDFLSRLRSLETRAMVGEWCLTTVDTKEHGQAIAIHMPTVWKVFDKEFTPSYSRSILECTLEQAGAIKGAVQKFWEDRELTLAYKRRLVTGGVGGQHADPPVAPNTVARKCLLLPGTLLKTYNYLLPEKLVTEVTDA
jgi:hypothetical protein